jgi:hypothetical protein
MLRWMFVVLLALILINWFAPFLNRMGFGKLPGDFRFKLMGREWYLPLSSTLLISFAMTALTRWL